MNRYFIKLKGGILYYSLIVMILSSSVIGLILLCSYYGDKVITISAKQAEIERNVFSAFNLFLGGMDVFKGKGSSTINLYGSSSDSVYLNRTYWGNYSIIKAGAKWKNKSYSKVALVGSNLFTDEHVALFMSDEGRFLSLSGKTTLTGTCYLPGKTARIAAIEGEQYIHKELAFGEIKASPHSLPELNKNLFSFANELISNGRIYNDSIINIDAIDSNYLRNPFSNKTFIVNSGELKNLAGYSFSGNIIILSTSPLIIEKSTKLEDVILLAPKIYVKNGFKGTFQAYAVQTIDIDENCDLGFPSQLCVIHCEGKYNPADSLIISIGKRSKLSGAAIIKSNGLTSFIKISSGAKIYGQIYCPGAVELQGDVIGSLYCKSFYLETPRSKYFDHLLNSNIDFNSLSWHFVGIDLIKENPIKSVIKWLN